MLVFHLKNLFNNVLVSFSSIVCWASLTLSKVQPTDYGKIP